MTSLYVELKQIVPEADGKSYGMTLFMQNIDPAVPLYVMLNAVGVYVQSGMSWQQVPSSPVGEGGTGIVKLVDSYTYRIRFTPDVANWAELIPGYMHVRIQADMLISRQRPARHDHRRAPHALLRLSEAARRRRRRHQGALAHVGHAARLHPHAAALKGGRTVRPPAPPRSPGRRRCGCAT